MRCGQQRVHDVGPCAVRLRQVSRADATLPLQRKIGAHTPLTAPLAAEQSLPA